MGKKELMGRFALLVLALAALAVLLPSASAELQQHDPIVIVGDNFIPANGVTGGTGTADDPYIIENWAIQNPGGRGIEIDNSRAYFVVRNCLLENCSYGVYFDNVRNGRVENCVIDNCSYGVYLLNRSDNNSIIGCTVSACQCGIYISQSENNTLQGNTLVSCSQFGVNLDHAAGSTISGGILRDCGSGSWSQGGIHLSYCENSSISGVSVAGCNQFGIFLEYSGGSSVQGCVVENGGHGIRIDYSPLCTLSGIQVKNGLYSGYALSLNYSSDNCVVSDVLVENWHGGIYIYQSRGETLVRLSVRATEYGGLLLDSSSNITVSDSSFAESRYYPDVHIYSCENILLRNVRYTTTWGAPRVSGIKAFGVNHDSAVIVWTTTYPLDSRVWYGTSTDYQYAVSDPSQNTLHLLELTGLSPSTTYHFKVSSSGTTYYEHYANYNITEESGDFTFTTAQAPPTGGGGGGGGGVIVQQVIVQQLPADTVPPFLFVLNPVTRLEVPDFTFLILAMDERGVENCWAALDGKPVGYRYENRTVSVELRNLSEGDHTLVVGAKDTSGNSAETRVEFRVSLPRIAAPEGVKVENRENIPLVREGTLRVENVPAGTTVEFRYDSEVTSVRIVAAENLPAVSLTLKRVSPPKPPSENEEAYACFDLSGLSGPATVEFRVSKHWTRQRGIWSVAAYQEEGGRWAERSVRFVREDYDYSYYETELPHFSKLLIAGRTITPAQALGQVQVQIPSYFTALLIILVITQSLLLLRGLLFRSPRPAQ
jgi:PGF-pre-PGF domain-containing protein